MHNASDSIYSIKEGNIAIAVIVWLKLAVVITLIDPDDDNVFYVRVCTGAIIIFFVNNGVYFELWDWDCHVNMLMPMVEIYT